MSVRRLLKRIVHHIMWLSSDALIQIVSIAVIIVIMTQEVLRVNMVASSVEEFASPYDASGPVGQKRRILQSPNSTRNASTLSREVSRGPAAGTGVVLGDVRQPVGVATLGPAVQRTPAAVSVQEFRGVQLESQTDAADDIKRLSFMLYRLVKTFKVSSILDVPCIRSLPWLPQLADHLEFEVPGFKYYCILENSEEYHEAKKLVQNVSSLHLSIRPEYWTYPLPKADLGFLWHSFGYLPPEKAWNLMQALRDLDVKFVVVPNNPLVERNFAHAPSHGLVNVRRTPYRFGEPVRIIQNVQKNGAEPKQLLFYNVSSVRDVE